MRLKHDYNFHGEAENKGGKMHGYQGHVRRVIHAKNGTLKYKPNCSMRICQSNFTS